MRRRFLRKRQRRYVLLTLYGLGMFFLGTFLAAYFDRDVHMESPDITPYEEGFVASEEYLGPVGHIPEISMPPKTKDPKAYTTEIVVKRNDVLEKLLIDSGAGESDTKQAIGALKKIYPVREIYEGQVIALQFMENETAEITLTALTIAQPEKTFNVVRAETGEYRGEVKEVPLIKRQTRAYGKIESNLYTLAVELAIPMNVLAEAVRYLSYDVDFQRDIQVGDTFEVLYEAQYNEQGVKVKDGNVLFILLKTGNKEFKYYRYIAADGTADYYDENGRNSRKFLLRTPIDGARISSGYGPRKHPILGYNKMHRGVDFAAPKGTPFFAAGDGTIDYIGVYKGYGNYIRIRHNSEFSTAYAHLSRFAKGLKRGSRVKQRQIIGYVGSTGLSTGPHLHFEILKNRSQVNPSTVALPGGQPLKGKEMERYKQRLVEIENLRAKTPNKIQS